MSTRLVVATIVLLATGIAATAQQPVPAAPAAAKVVAPAVKAPAVAAAKAVATPAAKAVAPAAKAPATPAVVAPTASPAIPPQPTATAAAAPAAAAPATKPATPAKKCMRLPLSDVAFGKDGATAAARVKLDEYAAEEAKKRRWGPTAKSLETVSCTVYLDLPVLGTEYQCLVTATFCAQ